jgi:hypothetical protein
MKLPANQVQTPLQSDVVNAVYKDVTFKVDQIAIDTSLQKVRCMSDLSTKESCTVKAVSLQR